MGLAVGTARYLLFIFNFIFFVTGVAIISVGGVALAKLKPLDDHTDAGLSPPIVLLIVVGVFVTLISFFGCCGAIRRSYCMLMTFAVLLILIFILELAAGIAAYVKRDNLADDFKKGFNQSFHDSKEKKWWDELQTEYQCCGVEEPSDWNNNSYLPSSCCPVQNSSYDKLPCCRNLSASNETCRESFPEGCFIKLEDYITKNIVTIGGVGVGIAFVQILGIVYACCLASAVKEMS